MGKDSRKRQQRINPEPEIYDTFLLYPQHKDFLPGISNLEFETLPTSIKTSFGFVGYGVFVLFLIIMAVGFFVGGVTTVVGDHRFLDEGENTSVQITGCGLRSVKNGKRPEVSYSYRVNDAVYSGEEMLYGSSCDPYPLGGSLTALYLPSDPTQLRFTEKSSLGSLSQDLSALCLLPGCMLLLLALPILAGVFLLYEHIHARRMYPRLKDYGGLVGGKIISISGHTPSKSNNFHVRIKYQFEAPGKTILTGEAQAHRQDLKNKPLPPTGTSIVVLYADDHAYMML